MMENKSVIIGRNLLETITSALYENPIILFREYVQNSLDAYNFAISEGKKKKLDDFCVSINIDKDNEIIKIVDNGYAIYTDEKFHEDMLGFGNSNKNDRSKYIGFRGIGRISALPFCESLTFISKATDSDHRNICIWNGADYVKLLNSDYDGTFQDVVQKIVQITSEPDNTTDHYFHVIIKGFKLELIDVLESNTFKNNLIKMLPLKYNPKFSRASDIVKKYNDFMGENLNDFMCSVKLNDEELYKNYSTKNILESDIIFKEIYGKSRSNTKKGEPKADKIGIMWFTFNKKITASSKDDDMYGILIRSKNVLMGNNDTFADLCANSSERITTYTELVATLRGVYGELLINSDELKDNARREWFRTDEHSLFLKNVIIDFMKHLYEYRYASSKYYRKSNANQDNRRIQLKDALVALVSNDNEVNIDSFTQKEVENIVSTEENQERSFSYEDVPKWSITKRKIYDELMTNIKDFFEKEKRYDLFLKLRAYIKNRMNG